MASFDITIRMQSSPSKYPAKAHARRVAQKLKLEHSVIALEGTKTAYFSNSDQKAPFRQDRYFYYLSGCDEPDCYVTYDAKLDKLVLHLPKPDFRRFFYDGRGSTAEEALEKYDIDEAVYLKEPSSLDSLTSGIRKAYTVGTLELVLALDACRAIKDADEIKLIREANHVTDLAFRKMLSGLLDLNNEAEAAALYVGECIRHMVKAQAYEPIVAAGPNASTLHYISDDAPLGDSQLLLVDAGAEWQHYASDVTRTIPLNRENPGEWPTEESHLLYEAVEAIQEECISMMRPDVKFSLINARADRLALDALLKLGVLMGSHDEIWEAGTSRAFFPHGLGHHVGLEVHDNWPRAYSKDDANSIRDASKQSRVGLFFDVPRVLLETVQSEPQASGSLTEIDMEPGNVITIEPGLYFNKAFLDMFVLTSPKHRKFINLEVLERYIAVGGVRIEDDILITKDGHENLTTTPKGKALLELLHKGNNRKKTLYDVYAAGQPGAP